MNVEVNRCYYHGNRPTVAVCQQCGVGICRECAVKDEFGKVICYKCGNSNLKEEHKKFREQLKQEGGRFTIGSEFIFPTIIGVLIVVVMIGGMYYTDYSNFRADFMRDGTEFIALLMCAYTLFTIPFSMIILNDIFAPRYDTWDKRFNKWYLKVCISWLTGWIVFPVCLIRFVWIKIKKKDKGDL